MKHWLALLSMTLAASTLAARPAAAEILAMVNYESKTADSLKALKLTGPQRREEGIAVIDVDPQSETFGDILMQIPLPPDLVAHHIFFDRTQTKAYVSALGQPLLHVIDLNVFPYRLKKVPVPGCEVGEDVIFAEDNRTWYLTCMGSGAMVVGDVATDAVKATVKLPKPYPHGLGVHQGIDRILVTNTVRASDLGDAGETITVLEASTNKVLKSIKLSKKKSPSGEAPVEILFVPGANPPVAFVTNMFGGTMWTAKWNAKTKDFIVAQAFDFGAQGFGVPLEMYFNTRAKRMYVTTAKPGNLHVFDIGGDVTKPTLLKTIPAAEGAHHVAFTKDMRLAFVQNALLNLPGMSDGSIKVVDLESEKVIASVDTLKNLGLNPNCIVLLPKWNHMAGH